MTNTFQSQFFINVNSGKEGIINTELQLIFYDMLQNVVLDFFNKFRFLKMVDLIELAKMSTLKTYEAGELIAEEGDIFPFVLGIQKGMIRTYILNADGDEITTRIAKEKDFCSCAFSVIRGEPSMEYLMAIEDCKVIALDIERLRKATENNIRILRLWNDAIMDAFIEAIQRIEFFAVLSPEERYKHLLNEIPDLLQRVPQKYLASYIGVTTVSFSRIRSRVSSK